MLFKLQAEISTKSNQNRIEIWFEWAPWVPFWTGKGILIRRYFLLERRSVVTPNIPQSSYNNKHTPECGMECGNNNSQKKAKRKGVRYYFWQLKFEFNKYLRNIKKDWFCMVLIWITNQKISRKGIFLLYLCVKYWPVESHQDGRWRPFLTLLDS